MVQEWEGGVAGLAIFDAMIPIGTIDRRETRTYISMSLCQSGDQIGEQPGKSAPLTGKRAQNRAPPVFCPEICLFGLRYVNIVGISGKICYIFRTIALNT